MVFLKENACARNPVVDEEGQLWVVKKDTQPHHSEMQMLHFLSLNALKINHHLLCFHKYFSKNDKLPAKCRNSSEY